MSVVVPLRASCDVRYDALALGEVMLRLDPGAGRVRTARTFAVSEGGGEYNVGRALRRVFGHRVALVTAIGANDVGLLLQDLLLQGGVDLDHVVWRDADDVGRTHRNPLNFTERGFGVRAARGVYDRAHSATASLGPDDVDWEHLFGTLGVRWFHTGGIFAGLSESTLDTVRVAATAARRHGTIVSYDVNFRPSLWAAAGGAAAAAALTEELLDVVDVLFGVPADGFAVEAERIGRDHPSVRVVATPRRIVHSASVNSWGGSAWSPHTGAIESRTLPELAVFDRVGGGDGFASGVIHGLLGGESLARALELGVAHGALVMTTPGDTSAAGLDEVEHLAAGGDASTRR